MKSLRLTALITFLLALPLAAFAEGVLRVPHQQGDDQYMPLKGVYTTVEIHDQVAITTVRNVFSIGGEDYVHPQYHFRLPQLASVSGFGYWEGEEFRAYSLRPGEQGGAGGGAHDNSALENYLGDNPFNITLDSIPPGDLEVQLQYVELLPYDFGMMSLTYPLRMYIASDIDTVSLEVSVFSQRQLTGIECVGALEQTADVGLNDQNSGYARVNQKDYRPAGDLQLNIWYNQEDIGAWIYTHRSDSTGDGYFLLVVEPGIVDPEEQVQKFFTFVFDRSGSMSGPKIVQARAGATACLNRMVAEDYFNIVDFANDVRRFRNQLVVANGANLQAARAYISNLQPGGATNISDALLAAVGQDMGEGTANQVVFFTDGQPTAGITDANEIRRRVSEANVHDARIFSFGVGQDLNIPLLRGLADENRGLCYIIDQNARIDTVVAEFYRYIATPALVNPSINFDDALEVDSLAPEELQDISAGRQLFLFGRYGSFGTFSLSLDGRMPQGDTSFVFEDIDFPEGNQENAFVPRMWAKATIDYWLNWMAIHGERASIIEKIVELSLRFGILTPYTEFEEPPSDTGGTAVEEPAFATVWASLVEGGVQLAWSPVGVASLVTYNVYRSVDGGEYWEKLNSTPLMASAFLDEEETGDRPAKYRVEMMLDGTSVWSEIVNVGEMPDTPALAEPYPNPFNSMVTINYSLPWASRATVSIYDLNGALVRRLAEGEQQPGVHTLHWEATGLPAGLFLVKLEADGVTLTRKVVLVK